jgi:putative nucleotidyltransferase with HDIG domain
MMNAMIPTPEECLLLLREFGVPQHVVDHSRAVHAVALFLCRILNQHGERLDQGRIEAASLLHDIAKISAMGTLESHAAAGARLLTELGLPEISEIVRQHVILDPGTNGGPIREAEVVHYADKRVKFTTIVPLAERFRDLKQRYGKTPEALAWLERMEAGSSLLEERLFRGIPIAPEALAGICVSVGGPDRGNGE